MLKIFNEYKNDILKEFGNGPMYDDQIKKYGKEHFPNFGGVYAHDQFKPVNGYCYVVNTGNKDSKGYHWTGIYVTPYKMYIFDSFHRNIHSIFRDIERMSKGRSVSVSKWPNPIQQEDKPEEENICGQLSLAWLQCIKNYGIKNAMLI